MKSKLRKIIFFILALSIMFSILGMSHMALASAGTFTTTTSVNMRSEPSTTASVVRVVPAGTSVNVLEHNPAGWSRVQIGDSTGFIRSDFLRFPTSGSDATFRTTEGVNLRAAGSTSSNILRTVVAGTSVEVTEHNPSDWSRVTVNGTSGFIRSDFLTRGGATGGATGSTGGTTSDTVIATLLTTGAVNMRSGSSTNTSIIRTLASNTSVEVLENQANGWSRVRQNGTNGFIRSDLLSATGAPAATTTLRTTAAVNFRAGASTNDRVIRTLAANTSVSVLENLVNGWSRVTVNGTSGFIRTDLLSATGASTSTTVGTLRTVTGVNMRTGPATTHSVIRLLPVNTSVEVLENQANGWSRVRHNNSDGFIRTDLLSATGAASRSPGNVELLNWSEVRSLIPRNTDIRVVDVRTGISFNLRAFSIGGIGIGGHADVEPPTQADTDAILRSRNGVWAWAPRPVWVTIGDRTFAAALNGMPHDVSTISGNGMNGHLCLHFAGTVTRSQSYQRDLRNAVQEAFDARPR